MFIFKFLAILAREVLRQRSVQAIAAQSPTSTAVFLRRFLAPEHEGGPEEIRMIYAAPNEKYAHADGVAVTKPGRQFVHYAMTDIPPRTEFTPSAERPRVGKALGMIRVFAGLGGGDSPTRDHEFPGIAVAIIAGPPNRTPHHCLFAHIYILTIIEKDVRKTTCGVRYP